MPGRFFFQRATLPSGTAPEETSPGRGCWGMLKVCLVVHTAGKWHGKTIAIPRLPFVIGRDHSCHLRPASTLVSQQHCALVARGQTALVRDLGSTNGTYLNGRQVREE